MSLAFAVEEAFAPGGVLSRASEYFVSRPGQTEMALAVTRAIEGAYPLVVEASTGVGKTFSYLVPALLSGERVLLSTATKALQDQLFGRDLPNLVKALGLPVRDVVIDPVTAAAGGRAQLDPAGSFVTGASIALGIDEGLGEQRPGAGALGPVVRQRRDGQAEHATGEIGLAQRGENQKAVVLHDQG